MQRTPRNGARATCNILTYFFNQYHQCEFRVYTIQRGCDCLAESRLTVHARSDETKGQRIMVNVTDEGQIFRCEICGNVVMVQEAGGGELVCCGEPMQLESD